MHPGAYAKREGGLTGRQARSTRLYTAPKMLFKGSDITIPQGTVESAFLVSSASCAGRHAKHLLV